MNKRKIEKRERNKARKEWRDNIIISFSYKCAIPGCETAKKLNAHHIIPREFIETRYDSKNGIALCPTHHSFGKFSAHKNALWFSEFLRKEYPAHFEYLNQKLRELENK